MQCVSQCTWKPRSDCGHIWPHYASIHRSAPPPPTYLLLPLGDTAGAGVGVLIGKRKKTTMFCSPVFLISNHIIKSVSSNHSSPVLYVIRPSNEGLWASSCIWISGNRLKDPHCIWGSHWEAHRLEGALSLLYSNKTGAGVYCSIYLGWQKSHSCTIMIAPPHLQWMMCYDSSLDLHKEGANWLAALSAEERAGGKNGWLRRGRTEGGWLSPKHAQ